MQRRTTVRVVMRGQKRSRRDDGFHFAQIAVSLFEIPELRYIVVKEEDGAVCGCRAGIRQDQRLPGDHQRRISQRPTFVDVVHALEADDEIEVETVIPGEREERVAARETRLPGRVDDDRPAGREELGPGTGERLGLG